MATPSHWRDFLEPLQQIDWVVYSKPPFGSPQQVLKYLARYTHRVAISNHRLIALQQGQITFCYKDYRDANRPRTMTLSAVEFTRRFLLHVLPKGFVRIRHYGFLANRCRREKLTLCRQRLAPAAPPQPTVQLPDSLNATASPAPNLCPACQQGRMLIIERLRPEEETVEPKMNSPGHNLHAKR